jgi:hypothetical protein
MAELSSDQQFKEVLAVAENQLKRNQIQVRFGPQGNMRFTIDEASLEAGLVQYRVKDDVFRKIFYNEIGPLLEANIRGNLETPLPFQDYEPDPTTRAARKEALQARAALVKEALVDDDLRSRYLLKASSKHPRLKACSWEIAKKLELSTKEPWMRHYATVSFEAITPIPQMGIFAWFPLISSDAIGRGESLAFDCDEEDLNDLIQALQDAKMALNRARS